MAYFELGLVARQLSLRLSHRCLERCRIDLHHWIPRMDKLALLVFYFRNLTRDTCGQRNGVERRDRAKRLTYTPMSPVVAVTVLIITGGMPPLLADCFFSRVEVEINSNCAGDENTCDHNQSSAMVTIRARSLR